MNIFKLLFKEQFEALKEYKDANEYLQYELYTANEVIKEKNRQIKDLWVSNGDLNTELNRYKVKDNPSTI
jgi:hypothetical protein